MRPMVESIQLPGRVRLQYVEHGDPSALPVLFLHGVTDSWHSFEPVLPHLPPSIHAFAISQRGHGDADRPDRGYGPADFVEDLAAFMDARHLGAAVIVGHSMSSSIALRFALDHPARTLGLVLVGAIRSWRATPAVREFRDAVVATLSDPVPPELAREFQLSTLAHPVAPAFLDTVVGETLKVPARVWKAVFDAFIEDDFSAALGDITAPTLIVWGDRDAFGSRHDQEAMAAAMAGARLLVYEGAGHALHWEQPDRFARDLVSWTQQAVGRPGAIIAR